MLQLKLLILFAFCVEIYPAHRPRRLVEADVIESFEARSSDRFDTVVGYKKVLFPAHEEVLSLLIVLQGEVWAFGGLSKRSPCWKSCPMLQIDLFAAAP